MEPGEEHCTQSPLGRLVAVLRNVELEVVVLPKEEDKGMTESNDQGLEFRKPVNQISTTQSVKVAIFYGLTVKYDDSNPNPCNIKIGMLRICGYM